MQNKIKRITLNKKSRHYDNYICHEMDFNTFDVMHLQKTLKKPLRHKEFYYHFKFTISDFFKYKSFGKRNKEFLNLKILIKRTYEDLKNLYKTIIVNLFSSKVIKYEYDLVGIVNTELYADSLYSFNIDHFMEYQIFLEMEDIFIIDYETK